MKPSIAVSMGIMRARGGASFRVTIGGVGEGVRRHHSNDVEKKNKKYKPTSVLRRGVV